MSDVFSAGQEIEAVLTRFDNETRRVSLSVKRLTADPFESLIEKYPVDTKVKSTVTAIMKMAMLFSFGSEIVQKAYYCVKDKIPPTTTYTEGGSCKSLTIADHDKRKHRILVITRTS